MTRDGTQRPSPFGEGSTGLGYPGGAVPPMPRVHPVPAAPPAPPGPAIAAAVLGFLAAAVFGLFAIWLVVGMAELLTGVARALVVLLLVVGWTALSAALAVGSLQLLQREGVVLLLRATRAELVVIGLAVVGAWLALDGIGSTQLLPMLLVGAAVAGVRLVLVRRPVVIAWLTDPRPAGDDGPVRALLVPHALVLVAALLAFWSATA